MALDGGLPLYKSRNCQKWHVRQKSGRKPKNTVVNGVSNNSAKQNTFRSKTTSKNAQSVKRSYGRSPTQYAGKNGNFTNVQQHTKNPGADKIRHANGMTPSHYAAKNSIPPRSNNHTNSRISFQPNDSEVFNGSTPLLYSAVAKGYSNPKNYKAAAVP